MDKIRFFLAVVILPASLAAAPHQENTSITPRIARSPHWTFHVEAGAGNLIALSFGRMNVLRSFDAGIGSGFDMTRKTVSDSSYAVYLINFNIFGLYRIVETGDFMVSGRVQAGYDLLKVETYSEGSWNITPGILAGYKNLYAVICGGILLGRELMFIPQLGLGFRFKF